ncbi:fungal-specific actin related protein [Neohortaea acidophila]|uniref:Fungal-specific actin related protein n=1 Tax=Neohortaea acidophila TaxID=245834 RepID=A0A6A6PJA5_9PEZI|nr:fungal-specific actin related protein [Neohortaea acidophila]KAF2480138.1 fungal-specific actin related protein [Neohortaea acidophila]
MPDCVVARAFNIKQCLLMTPLLARSLSSQYGSPSAFRSEQEDIIIYELGARHISAGFAGESRPRCVVYFNPERDRRLGDYRACDSSYRRKRRKIGDVHEWSKEYELYRVDLKSIDLGLVEDRLERAVRTIQIDHLQLDQKARKAALVVPSLLPTPLLDIAMRVLFNYSTQPPSIVLLTTPVMACVGAGLRNAIVVDVGWEETVVTAVGEYKEVFQRRSVRAGRTLVTEMSRLLEEEVKNGTTSPGDETSDTGIDFEYAEEVTQRMAWCRARSHKASNAEAGGMTKLPAPESASGPRGHIHLPFTRLSKPAENAFFAPLDSSGDDDHSTPIHTLVYRVLLALPVDLRAICMSRIIVTGGVSALPGLKPRLLEEVSEIIAKRGWDPVDNYGSVAGRHPRKLQERSANIAGNRQQEELEVPLSPTKKPIQESVRHADRIHDDKYDSITLKAEREAAKGKAEVIKGTVRGVETVGAWAGASLVAASKVKGVHEVEREAFLKHGYRDGGVVI